ncbi:tetratricopeptide repeat protein [Thalassotalea castellviae]|uniref:Tetratricopeptide repeat protein n=1 Tax=Thalassotalea castellviae TaxID=3075612 RepID=A0ABU2ZZT6_9GAMM|nr:tetratricopeptide repeat protein [Thalassotalea sp. W431]MDT0603442.1 tetratricopeptide repeat protein [Thalassotalea sp. W431]
MNVAMTVENFQKIIVEDSKEKLVLVDFWAEQVPESVELRDKLASSLNAFEAHILLATVDCQTEQQIAQQFGIQGLPTAVLVKDGQPIDGLSGPQTDDTIKAFLDKHLPKEEDLLFAQAQKLIEANDINQAFTVISQAYQLNNERADIKLLLADVYIQTGKISEAESLLSTILMVDQGSEYQAVMAKLELASQAANSPEIQALESELAKAPDNVELQQNLAAQYSQVNRHEEALTLLFRLVQKDSSDQKSKDLLLDILKALPDGDPLATKFRRKLYTLMY